jgi:hypothetical protein
MLTISSFQSLELQGNHMAKAIVSWGACSIVTGIPVIAYSAAIIDTTPFAYSADYKVNTGISLAANFLAFQNKVIAECLTKGTTLAISDVITFGAPT